MFVLFLIVSVSNPTIVYSHDKKSFEISCTVDNVCFNSKSSLPGHREILDLCDDSDFLCVSDSHAKCISDNKVCDLNKDCENGEDENMCGKKFSRKFREKEAQ